MGRYKIGVTEGGDAGIDLAWVDKLDKVDAAVVITKRITPGFKKAVLDHQDKIIVHATTTGLGGSILEPHVQHPDEQLGALSGLVECGFPVERTVVRTDPIIPTTKGIYSAANVIRHAIDLGFSSFRVSIIDMHPHVRERFKLAGLPLPYGDQGFSPSEEQVFAVDNMLAAMIAYYEYHVKDDTKPRFECCAEPGLMNAIQCGCVSAYDLGILGLGTDDDDCAGYQRKHCMCYSGKTELLGHKSRCANGCLYCFWR